VQLDEGTHERQAEAGAAMPRPVGMTLEPVEHLVFDIGRDARTGVGHAENDSVFGSFGAQADGGILRRKIRRHSPSRLYSTCTTRRFVAHEVADVGSTSTLSSMRSVASRSWMPSAAASMVLRMSTEPS